MLRLLTLLIGILWAQVALAANPVITIPVGQIVLPNTATTISGISISEAGASALLQFTNTITSQNGTLTVTGGGTITGSGTNSVTIKGNAAQINAASISVTYTTSALLSSDTLTINSVDANALSATPAVLAVKVDGNKYLSFGTLAAAQARSQAMATAMGIPPGSVTKCWWQINPNAGTTVTGDNCTGTASPDAGASIQIRPGDPSFDFTPTAQGPWGANATAHGNPGLNTTEQGTLVNATQASQPPPPAPNAVP